MTGRVRYLTWRTIVDAVEAFSNPHYAWVSLREFLLEERIALPRIDSPVADAAACIDLLVDVNERVKASWPGNALAWQSGALRTALSKGHKASHGQDIVVDAGLLKYGIVFRDGLWTWHMRLSVGKNYGRVKLDPKQMLQVILSAGLPDDWQVYPDRLVILERTLPAGSATSSEDVVEWFEEGLTDLKNGSIVEPYLRGLAAKKSRPVQG